MEEIIKLDEVDKYNKFFGLETRHPLVSVVDLSKATRWPEHFRINYWVYALFLKDTRCGDIDPYVPLYIMKTQNLSIDQVNEMLNKKSGKYGLGGYSDSRDFEAAYLRGEPAVVDGMKCYIYSIVKFIGAYIAAMGGVDALVFTAGVGENSGLVRKLILEKLSYLGIEINNEVNNATHGDFAEITQPGSKVRAFVIPTNEELVIAKDTVALTK